MSAIKAEGDHSPSDDKKKLGVEPGQFETATVDTLPPDPDDSLSAEERAKIDRALLWKLDIQLIPWLSFLYLISFLDRTNIGNARVVGTRYLKRNERVGLLRC